MNNDTLQQQVIDQEKHINKITARFDLLNMWLEKRNEHKSIADYLRKKNIDNVAVYGLGSLGQRLLEELLNEGINVSYIVDSRKELHGGRYQQTIPVISTKYIAKYDKTKWMIISLLGDRTEIEKSILTGDPRLKLVGLEEIIKSF